MTRAETIHSLDRLRVKYRTLAELREARESAEAAGHTEFGDAEIARRTEAFRGIAREFPGSLRELEWSGAGRLRSRESAVAEALDRQAADPDVVPLAPWISVVLDYHRLWKESLAIKAWLASRIPRGAEIDATVVGEFLERRRGRQLAPMPDSEARDWLESHRRPPGGRLHNVVFQALEGLHGRGRRDLERAIFGSVGDDGGAPGR